MSFQLDKPGEGNHRLLVNAVRDRFIYYKQLRDPVMQQTREYLDLYLTQKREHRNKGEEWRAAMALPDAYASIETLTANEASILLGADPMVQPEGVHDQNMESARSVEKLIDYTYRKNQYTKGLIKLLRSKNVYGTSFYKWTWSESAHTVTMTVDEQEAEDYSKQIEAIIQTNQQLPMAPDWRMEPKAFEEWRKVVNMAGAAQIPPPPLDGPQRVIIYRGPRYNQLPLESVYLDPSIDELYNQNLVIYRTVKPMAWLEAQVAKGLYDKEACEYAMDGWDGQVKEEQEIELLRRMRVSTDQAFSADPQYAKAVCLWEVWQPFSETPYSLILNEKAVINKNPYEMPFIHGEIGIGAARGTVMPGNFYGISALDPAKDVFWEKRKLRNLRLDAATLNVMPAYTRLKEVGLPEMMHKIRPGAVIPVSRPDAISALLKQPMPPEAYREPEELDADIADAMGVYASTKGAPAAVGRVTGTEYQGRENRTQIRFKLNTQALEEDLYPQNRQIVAMWAQMSPKGLRMDVGGSPDPFVNLSRAELMESMEIQWRFRGPNKAINRDMQVQQLYMWYKTFAAMLTPAEARFAAKVILEQLDIRGSSLLVSDEGTSDKTREYEAAKAAAQAQQGAQQDQADQMGINVPAAIDAPTAQALGG